MDATPSPADAELAVLADVIWAQRTALEQLAFRLTALRLVLGADLRRYVGRCLEEVDATADRLEQVETRRAVAHEAVCRSWGRSPGSVQLADLAQHAPEPWATVFADHHDHLRALVSEVERTADENARLCNGALEELRDELATAGAVPVAGARGRATLRLAPAPATTEGRPA